MSWLYERRDQLDGLRPFVEIAHRLIAPVPYHDRDDVEQEIVITLKGIADKHGEVAECYLWGAARNVVNRYWRRRYRQAKRLGHLIENNRGEMVAETWQFVSNCEVNDARLDAITVLATLPKRLVEIGYKRLDREKLSEADEWYWMRHKAKLNCRKRGDQLSDWEKKANYPAPQSGSIRQQNCQHYGQGQKDR